MPNIKTLLLALIVLLFGGSAAFAQPLSDIASYTNWSLANSANPFSPDGHKGITHEEAARLPVGALITLPDGSVHALKRGETVWKLGREYARKAPLASRSVQSTASTKAEVRQPRVAAAKPTAPAVNQYALQQARIQARYEAEQETAQLAVEAHNLRMAAESNLQLATDSADAAFAADRKSEAREHIDNAKSVAEAAQKNAAEAASIATTSERVAGSTDSLKAARNAAAARESAVAIAATAAKTVAMANRATKALDFWVTNWPPTIVLAVIVFLAVYILITSALFRYWPSAFNFIFRTGLSSESYWYLPVKLLALPAFAIGGIRKDDSFFEEHYDYLNTEDTTDVVVEEGRAPTAYEELEPDDAFAADPDEMDEEKPRFSPYLTDTRLEVHQVLH